MKNIINDAISFIDYINYPRENINDLFLDLKSLSWKEIIALGLPAKYLLWIFLHPDFLPLYKINFLAHDFAKRVQYLTPDVSREIFENNRNLKRQWMAENAMDEALLAEIAADDVEREFIRSKYGVEDAALVAAALAVDAAQAAVRAVVWETWAIIGETAHEGVYAAKAAYETEINAQLTMVIAALEES